MYTCIVTCYSNGGSFIGEKALESFNLTNLALALLLRDPLIAPTSIVTC